MCMFTLHFLLRLIWTEKQNAPVKSLVFKRNLDIFWKCCHFWMKGSEQTLYVCTVHHTFPESKQQQLDILQELVCCFSDTEAFFSFCMLLENIMGEQSRQLSVKYEKKQQPTFNSLSTLACRSATSFSCLLCKPAIISSIFFLSCETEAVRSAGQLRPWRGAFLWLYRGSLWKHM